MAHKNSHSAPRKKGGALKIVLVLLVLLLVVAGGGVWMAKREIDGGTPGEEVTVSIQQGSGVSTIANALKEAGVIKFPRLFRWYVGKQGAAAKLQYGEFTLAPGSSYNDLIEVLSEYAKAESVRLTFPEGTTAIAMARKMEDAGLCTAEEFLKEANTGDFSEYKFWQYVPDDKDAPDRFLKCEGYLFPDTYEFYVIDDLKDNPDFDTTQYAKQAAEKMYANFESKITRSMYARATELGMTFDQVITLASIIQKEGTNPDNMENISSVFHNRLEDQYDFPHLQSDTTEYYIRDCIEPGIPSGSRDLYQNIIDAYDTYVCDGLPAGPICSPGLEAINAALYPAETDYYYFLSSSDGVFYYANTAEKHEQNIIDAALREED